MAAAHGVTLSWPASASVVTGYNVYRFDGACAPGITFVKLTASPITGLTYTDTNVVPGNVYCYTETSVSPGGESANNGELQAEIPLYIAPTVPLPPGSATSVIN